MLRPTACACLAALLLAAPALAQTDTTPDEPGDRRALEDALSSVNEGGRDPLPPIPGRTGFFGDGFYMTFEPIANGVGTGQERYGTRPETSTTYRPERSDAFLRR